MISRVGGPEKRNGFRVCTYILYWEEHFWTSHDMFALGIQSLLLKSTLGRGRKYFGINVGPKFASWVVWRKGRKQHFIAAVRDVESSLTMSQAFGSTWTAKLESLVTHLVTYVNDGVVTSPTSLLMTPNIQRRRRLRASSEIFMASWKLESKLHEEGWLRWSSELMARMMPQPPIWLDRTPVENQRSHRNRGGLGKSFFIWNCR